MYTTRTPGRPTQEYPIPQTYVDVILTGCLAINTQFAKKFVQMTTGWRGNWINDRKNPMYARTEVSVDTATIDSLLERLVPEAFKRRI